MYVIYANLFFVVVLNYFVGNMLGCFFLFTSNITIILFFGRNYVGTFSCDFKALFANKWVLYSDKPLNAVTIKSQPVIQALTLAARANHNPKLIGTFRGQRAEFGVPVSQTLSNMILLWFWPGKGTKRAVKRILVT